MPKTRFRQKTLSKLEPGDWTDERYPNLRFRVGQKARTWVYRPPRRADGSRPGCKLGRFPDLSLDAAVKKYNDEKGRLARGEPHPDLEKRIRELEEELRALKRAAGKLVTFGSLVELFLKDYIPPSGRPLAAATRKRHVQLLSNHALPRWGDWDVEQIEDSEVETLIAEITNAGAPFAANHLLKLLKTVFRFGIKKKIVTVNPCANIATLRENERTRVLSPEELRAVWLAFSSVRNYGVTLQFLALTWQRRKEVADMPWSEIQGDWWCLPGGDRTKNRKPNLIFLTPLAQAILSRQRSRSPSSDYVFPGLEEDRPVSKPYLTRLCKNVSDRLLDQGQITASFSLHDLRRTAATLARSQGAERRVVERILNHSSNTVTDIYDLYGMGPEIQETLTRWDHYLTDLLGLKPEAD